MIDMKLHTVTLLSILLLLSGTLAMAQPSDQGQEQGDGGLFGGLFDGLFGGGDQPEQPPEQPPAANDTNATQSPIFGDNETDNATNATTNETNETFPGEAENVTEFNETNQTNQTNQTNATVNETNATTNETNETAVNDTVTNITEREFEDIQFETVTVTRSEAELNQTFNDTVQTNQRRQFSDEQVNRVRFAVIEDGNTVQAEVYRDPRTLDRLKSVEINDVRQYGDTIVVRFTEHFQHPCTDEEDAQAQQQTDTQAGVIGDAVQFELDDGDYFVEFQGRAVYDDTLPHTCSVNTLSLGEQ